MKRVPPLPPNASADEGRVARSEARHHNRKTGHRIKDTKVHSGTGEEVANEDVGNGHALA
jgi:hypothetical protein